MTKPITSQKTGLIINSIKYVGEVHLFPGTCWTVTKYPNWFHRYFTKLLLGWKWSKYNE